jgi:hypothetical protein
LRGTLNEKALRKRLGSQFGNDRESKASPLPRCSRTSALNDEEIPEPSK